jgi:hypothetical protein
MAGEGIIVEEKCGSVVWWVAGDITHGPEKFRARRLFRKKFLTQGQARLMEE